MMSYESEINKKYLLKVHLLIFQMRLKVLQCTCYMTDILNYRYTYNEYILSKYIYCLKNKMNYLIFIYK